MIDDTLLDMRGDMFVWLVVVVVAVVIVGIPTSLSIWMRRAKRIEERV
jgi:Sec-independent protein translocase protein TatA